MVTKQMSKDWESFMGLEPFYNDEVNPFPAGLLVKLTYLYQYDDGDTSYSKRNFLTHSLSLHYQLKQTKQDGLKMKDLLSVFAGTLVDYLTSIQSSGVLYTDLIIESDKPLVKNLSRLKYTIYEGEGQIDASVEGGEPMKHLDPFVTELTLGDAKTYRFLLYGTPRSLQRFDNKSARESGLSQRLLSFTNALFAPSKFGHITLTPVRERSSESGEGAADKKVFTVLGSRFRRKLT